MTWDHLEEYARVNKVPWSLVSVSNEDVASEAVAPSVDPTCPICRAPIAQKMRGRRRVYCSDSHKMQAYLQRKG